MCHMCRLIEDSLPFDRKRRAESPPSDSNEPVQKTPRMHLLSSPSNAHHKPPPPPAPPSAANKLPLEIWMTILESVDHSHHIARPSYVNCFVQAIISGTATSADLVPELPTFEKEAWLATRPYYAINTTSRQAAHQTFLSGVLLQTTTAPLNQVPLKRHRGRRDPHLPRTSIPPPFFPSAPLAKMQPRISAESEGSLEPTYMPLELFDYRLFHDTLRPEVERKTPAVLQARFAFMIKLFDEHHERLSPMDVTLLRTVRRVDLLAAAPYEHLMKPARVYAEMLERMIMKTWAQFGVEGGVVRVLH
jgi:hypothetical protein